MSVTTTPSSTKTSAVILPPGREWPMEGRIVPMEVLVLGLCRTGTLSITMALKQLGYNDVYHMREVFTRNDADLWVAALEAKYEGKGAEWGREEWDRLLGDCMAVTDIPAAMFVPELLAAYPDAKVVLTTRSVDSWVNSMMHTVYALWSSPWRRMAARLNSKAATMRRLADKYNEHLWWNDFPRYGRRCFTEHNDLVRRLVPSDRLLEYEVREGWVPLCEFLDKDVPATVSFPRVNDTKSFRDSADRSTMNLYRGVAWRTGKVLLPVLAIGGAIWWRAGLRALLDRR